MDGPATIPPGPVELSWDQGERRRRRCVTGGPDLPGDSSLVGPVLRATTWPFPDSSPEDGPHTAREVCLFHLEQSESPELLVEIRTRFGSTLKVVEERVLHVLRARLRGGLLNKAQRGELPLRLPVGLVDGPAGRVVLDPDAQGQGSIRLLFEVFARVGSAHGVVKHFREHGLLFPLRLHTGPGRGDLVWLPLGESRALHVLRNPRYAGAYAFGKSVTRRTGEGRPTFRVLPRESP